MYQVPVQMHLSAVPFMQQFGRTFVCSPSLRDKLSPLPFFHFSVLILITLVLALPPVLAAMFRSPLSSKMFAPPLPASDPLPPCAIFIFPHIFFVSYTDASCRRSASPTGRSVVGSPSLAVSWGAASFPSALMTSTTSITTAPPATRRSARSKCSGFNVANFYPPFCYIKSPYGPSRPTSTRSIFKSQYTSGRAS